MTRQEFEEFLSQSPHEKSIARWPNDEERYAWPGHYKDYAVQLAWEVLQAAQRREKENKE